jgi:hypothetical protein
MKHIEALIEEGGEITVGAVDGIECAATAADEHNALVMLARREGESIAALIKWLDRALGKYYETGETVDEINPADD